MLRMICALALTGVAFAAAYEGWLYGTGQAALHPLLSGFVGGFALAAALFAAFGGEEPARGREIDWNGRL